MAGTGATGGRTDADLDDVERLAGIGSWVWFPDDGRMWWSDGLRRVLDLKGEVAPSFDGLASCFHPQDVDAFRTRLAEVVEGADDLIGDYRVIAGRDVRWIFCRARLDAAVPERTRRIVGIFQDVTEGRSFLDELSEAATRDPLTGLLNRVAIADRLEHALERLRRQEKQVAVMFVDLDGLKVINDRLGHRVGDSILRAVGDHLRDATRLEDSVGRYGGDEFVVVCEDIATAEDALVIADRIVARLRFAPDPQLEDLGVTASVGVTSAERGETAPAVLARSDAAMYEAKRGGGARVVFFQPPSSAV